VNPSDRARRERTTVLASVGEQPPVVPVERCRRELVQANVAECRPEVALDVAGHLACRLRREVDPSQLEPPVEQLPHRGVCPGRQAALGLDDHLVEHAPRLALAAAHRLRGIALLAAHRVDAQVHPELPR
jgi:hypothetical protein